MPPYPISEASVSKCLKCCYREFENIRTSSIYTKEKLVYGLKMSFINFEILNEHSLNQKTSHSIHNAQIEQ